MTSQGNTLIKALVLVVGVVFMLAVSKNMLQQKQVSNSIEQAQSQIQENMWLPSPELPADLPLAISENLQFTDVVPQAMDDGTFKVEIPESTINQMITANIPQDMGSENPVTTVQIDLGDGSATVYAQWKEGQTVSATVAPTADAKSFSISNVDVSGFGFMDSVFESAAGTIMEQTLTSVYSQQDMGNLERIEIKPEALIIYYSTP